ncbi:MAG: PAS domain S-box protein [Candidatus Marinimicrobia bacterium]|nr:PAS domain S-box protein [Candidatus Neomarinimicrobiota bacterium]
MQKLNNFEDIHIPRVSDLPASAQREKEVLEALNIQSTIVVPIVYKNNLMGYLGFDSVRKERLWPNEIIILLRIVGEIIANALKRKEAELMFEKFVEYAPIGIYYSDFEGTINYANKKTKEIIGYKQQEFVGTNIFDLNIIDPKWKYKALKLLASNKKGSTTGPDEFLLNHKDGSRITVALNTRVITFNGKQVILGMISDITEQKQMENHLRQSQKMEAITMLTGGVAHDFNNILGSIFGAVDLLQLQLAEDHPGRRYANIILDRSQKAAVLVKQMLAYSRQQHLNLKPLNINQTIEEVSVLLDLNSDIAV